MGNKMNLKTFTESFLAFLDSQYVCKKSIFLICIISSGRTSSFAKSFFPQKIQKFCAFAQRSKVHFYPQLSIKTQNLNLLVQKHLILGVLPPCWCCCIPQQPISQWLIWLKCDWLQWTSIFLRMSHYSFKMTKNTVNKCAPISPYSSNAAKFPICFQARCYRRDLQIMPLITWAFWVFWVYFDYVVVSIVRLWGKQTVKQMGDFTLQHKPEQLTAFILLPLYLL